jgi:putative (di)nucleoside polyphosphate hydrolase
MSDVIDRDGYRANVGMMLMSADDKLFIARRAGGRGWQCPQGGMRSGETAEESLFRELKEEIGLAAGDVQIIGRTRHWLRYRLPSRCVRHDVQPLCLGQKQYWFLLRLRHADIRIRFDLTAQPEFDRWRWVDYWQPIREVIYFKRAVYTRALHELGPLAFPGGTPPYPAWWRKRAETLAPAAPTAL